MNLKMKKKKKPKLCLKNNNHQLKKRSKIDRIDLYSLD